MRYHRSDIIDRAIAVLDAYGLPSLTMRRLATELGVQPSALYHHVPNKQALLAAVADEILLRGQRPRRARTWDGRVVELCAEIRDAMLAYQDGAEVVLTAHTFGLGAEEVAGQLHGALQEGGLSEELADLGTRTLLPLVFGHTTGEQTALQAAGAGAIDQLSGQPADFEGKLELVLDGLRGRIRERSNGPPDERGNGGDRRDRDTR